jgi:bifunctional non-homologous end joining protein LigD
MDDILRPMLASLVDAPLTDPHLVYEPKYDGIRAIAEISRAGVRLWSRLGNEKTAQFPEIVDALLNWARRSSNPLILDGEIVALDAAGEPTGFQQLQGRIHLTEQSASNPPAGRTAFIAFDLLREGKTDVRDRPLVERRAALERIFRGTRSSLLRISESVRGDGRALYKRAIDRGWEGIIAKHADSRYRSGKRTPDWRKLKIVHQQEFVIGGWTEPRQTRAYFGALLLGVYQDHTLVYVGHTGTGFNEAELARVMKRLGPLEISECPFRPRPKTNERPHWVQPKLVAQIKFTEWTADHKLRHPVYLGLRDDKNPEDVTREAMSRHATVRQKPDTTTESTHVVSGVSRTKSKRTSAGVVSGFSRTIVDPLIDQLHDLEKSRRDGALTLPDGDRLSVTNLQKVFWPRQKLTKGDLFRYYVKVAGYILPALEDRPLTMKRLPNGITGQTFYQHRAPDHVPANVRVESVPGEQTVPSRFIGGDLKTLLYMTQLAAISQDPWFSRIGSVDAADHVALDLDPAEGVPFQRVLDVARWIRDELTTIGAVGVPKTSGADGLHVYLPLPPETPYEAGLIVCQIVATVVAQDHPKVATIERSVRTRGPRVYIDYMQNVLGKTLATAYSARASEYAGASTPLTWDEIDRGIRREDFTIETVPARLEQVGDLWKPLRASPGIDLARVSEYAASHGTQQKPGKRR